MVKVLWTPVSGPGGSKGTLTQKSTFPNEFCAEMRTTDKVIHKNQNKQKKKKSKIGFTVTKKAKTHKISPTKTEKTIFPKEFFHGIWFIIEDCKYNYIAEKK